MELEQQIQEVISNHMPKAAADLLQKRLRQADEAERNLTEARAALDRVNQELSQLRKNATDQATLVRRETEVAKREEVITKQEQAIATERAIAAVKLECGERRTSDLFTIVGMVFRNREIVESVSRQIPFMTPGNSYPDYHNESSNKTTTAK